MFAFLSDNKKNTFDGYEVSNYRLSDFEEVIVDFPSKAATSFKKINNYWYQTKPFQTKIVPQGLSRNNTTPKCFCPLATDKCTSPHRNFRFPDHDPSN